MTKNQLISIMSAIIYASNSTADSRQTAVDRAVEKACDIFDQVGMVAGRDPEEVPTYPVGTHGGE